MPAYTIDLRIQKQIHDHSLQIIETVIQYVTATGRTWLFVGKFAHF